MTREDFEYWLSYMDDALERWLGDLPSELRTRLDYSVESLDAIERHILNVFATPRDARAPANSAAFDGAARYVGETVRRRLGARWDIVLDRPKYAFFGLPILRAPGMKTDECPHSMVTAAIDRKRGTYLRQVMEAHARAVDAAKARDAK